jgi:hypothetical protein
MRNLMFFGVAIGLALIIGFEVKAAAPAIENNEFPAAGLSNVEATNRSGAIRISAERGPKVKVRVSKTVWAPTCVLTVERVDERLVVRVEQSGFVDSDDCRADVDIRVPKTVNLTIAEGSGPVDIKGVEGNLDFKIGSGNLKAEGRFAIVTGESGSGNVTVKGLAGGGKLDSGSGNLELKFAQAALKGAIEINVASGNANLFFPKGTKVQSKLTAASGKLTNELGESTNAEFTVAMRAASGNLTIKSY